jgi:4-amino-4-deoxy-L-arabinose transferase-like glycosyltransferase
VNTTLSRLRLYPRPLLLILAFGLVLRIAFISLHQRALISDEKEYDQLAYNIASNASYEFDGRATAYRPIGYPAIVSLTYILVGHHSLGMKFLQAFLDITSAFLIYLLLAGCSDRVRLLGAGLWVLYVPAILYTNLLMAETVFTFVLTLSVLVMIQNPDNRARNLALLGLLFGIQVLIKPGAAIFLLGLPFLFFRFKYSSRHFYAFAAAFLLTLTPWILRNNSVLGHFSLTSNGGVNLLIGNNPHATGAYGITFDAAILGNSKDEFDADQKALQSALGYIAGNPGTFIVNAARKIARLCESEGGLLVWTFHNNPEDSSTHYAAKYASIPLLLDALTNLPYFIIFIAGIFGFLSYKKEQIWWTTALLLASWILLHAVFFGGGRFHFPVMPLVTLFAAIFLGDVRGSVRNLSKSQSLVGIMTTILFITLWIYEEISIHNA